MKERCPVCHMTGQHKLQCPNRDGFQPKFSARRVERGPKVLFLDFDGVINSTAFHETREKQKPNFEPAKLSMEWWAEGIDPDAVGRLNGLLKRTGAKVVVSSSWRLGTDRAWLQRVLEMRGFEGDVIGITERYTGNRCFEIRRWLETTRVQSFAILDDDWDARIVGHFVKTDSAVGLTDEDVEKAVEILGEAQGT